MKPKGIIVAQTLFRDSAKTFDTFRRSIEIIKREAEDSGYEFLLNFLENDSLDDTRERLSRFQDENPWVKGEMKNFHTPKFGGVAQAERMRLMAFYRNLLKCDGHKGANFYLVFDSDIEVFEGSIKEALAIVERDESIAILTANTTHEYEDFVGGTGKPAYYDTLAFVDKNGESGVVLSANPFIDPQDRIDWDEGRCVQVQAAFGSMSLIRGCAFENARWGSLNGDVEHVAFCRSISPRMGKVVCAPTVKAWTHSGVLLNSRFIESAKRIGIKRITTATKNT